MRLKLPGLVAGMLALAGCSATFHPQMPAAPTATRVAANSASPTIGLGPVRDARGRTDAGFIGAAHVEITSELPGYLHDSFAAALSQHGYAVVDVTQPPAAASVKNIVQVSLEAATASTIDAVLQPVTVQVSIVVQVVGPSGTISFAHPYSGSSNERLGMHGQSGYEESLGALLSTAANEAIERTFADPAFLKALTASPSTVS